MTQGAATRGRPAAGSRREEILRQAEHLFAAHGVHSVSTRQIAEAVGVTQPTLYAHFPRKSDILQEVSARAFVALHDAAMASEAAAGDPLEGMVRAYIAFGLEQPDAYRIAFMIEGLPKDEPLPDPCLPRAAKPGEDAFENLRGRLALRMGPGHPDLEVAAQSLWAAMHGLVSLLLARGGFAWAERGRLVDWHVAALLRGVPVSP